ncbi:MAG: Rieske (2Fe-2S) protein, partial [Acidobacteria bacterium]|nr:Rieske (2Fe-2S) protein [Acidobacteriota bacterium]
MSYLRNCEPSLRRTWLPLCRSDEAGDSPVSRRLMGDDWAIWRDSSGRVRVFLDQCPHRRAPLTTGWCEGDRIRCGYHGWMFDGEGTCVEIPALGEGAAIPPRARLTAPAEVVESHHMIY